MPAKPKIYSFQVDADTEAKIEADRQALEVAIGQKLSVSQYFRLIVDQRISGGAHDPREFGYGEGFRAGFADFNLEFQTFMHEFLVARTAKPS